MHTTPRALRTPPPAHATSRLVKAWDPVIVLSVVTMVVAVAWFGALMVEWAFR